LHDIPTILALINGYAAQGIMLPRTDADSYIQLPMPQPV
jgi:N-acetylglutamate synthase-like GNAT family acetyltransferase